MKKSYYFSHDYNAHNDVKILFLRQQLGMEGYGIYWFIIESLANAGGRLPLKILPVLAMQMQTSEVKVLAVIKEFDLFQVIDEDFFSLRLIQSIDILTTIKKINSEKGKKSAAKREAKATAVEPQLNSGSTNKIKEDKIDTIVSIEPTEKKVEIPIDSVCYNVEEYLLANQIKFEAICIKTNKTLVEAKNELMKCHLHLEKHEKYPMAKKAALAWVTSWMINAKDFNAKYLPSQAEKKSTEAPKKNIDELVKKYQN